MTDYRGRFAPTPSGPLHLGSLLAAVGSWLQARHAGGRWFLRIDDLDRARCPPGADLEIQRQLRVHGLDWDGAPRYQSAHVAGYQAALHGLQVRGVVYACRCTRAELAGIRLAGPDGPVYPGRCRAAGLDPAREDCSLRMRIGNGRLCLDDGLRGTVCRELQADVGDFVVRRADRQIAYQLACAVDERAQGITEVVRGADLLGSSFQQLCVMDALQQSPPRYLHLPVLVGADGAKLSKQNHAAPLQDAEAAINLRRCLAWLGQDAPPAAADTPGRILEWAVPRWSVRAIGWADPIPVT